MKIRAPSSKEEARVFYLTWKSTFDVALREHLKVSLIATTGLPRPDFSEEVVERASTIADFALAKIVATNDEIGRAWAEQEEVDAEKK